MHRFVLLLVLAAGLGCSDPDQVRVNGTVVDLEDPSAPFMTIGEDGTLAVLRADPTTGLPSGLTVMLSDGRSGELVIDPTTGHPAYWSSGGYVIVFSNVRPTEGLADIGIITPQGDSGEELDVSFPALTPSAAPSSMFMLTAQERRAKFNELVSALDTAVSLTACAGGAIITSGSAVAGIAVPPAGVPLFTTSGAATAAICSAAFIKLMALNPDNTVFAGVNDTIAAAGLPGAVAECLTKPGVIQCLRSAAEVASVAGSSVVQAVSATFLQLRDGVAQDVPYQVYCCNGPTQVEVNTSETWRAAVVEGTSNTPFTFKFNPGDSTPETWLNSSNYGIDFSHQYTSAGTRTMSVAVRDALGTEVGSNATVTGPLTTFQVRVYEPLSEVSCCSLIPTDLGNPAFVAGNELAIRFDVAQGKRPYSYTMTFGDGKQRTGTFAGDFTNVVHTYRQSGDYELTVTVTDATGVSATSTATVVSIAAPALEPSCYDACYHLCSNIWGQNCFTGTMGNAKTKVSTACGAGFSAAFASNAEVYCNESLGMSGDPDSPEFTVDGCVSAGTPAQ